MYYKIVLNLFMFISLLCKIYLNGVMRKPTVWFPNSSDIDWPVQLQNMARSLKFWIQEEEEFYPCSEKEALTSFAVTAKQIRICNMLVFS